MQQVTRTQPVKLEQHLSVSQYMQCVMSAAGGKQLRLCHQPRLQRPTVAALCVDHKLRQQGSHECQQAATQASAMGLKSHIMQVQWPQLPTTGHLMEQASIMRYQLLHHMCKACKISVLLTGHHAGDQAETFMMRLTRGSGVAGLAGIAEVSWSSFESEHPLLLVRPFLELPKWQLEAACTEQGLTWANDPTNQDTTYLRNHMRALLSQSESQHQAKQQRLAGDGEPHSLHFSPHQSRTVNQDKQQPEKHAYVSDMGLEPLPDAASECPEGVVPAIVQVQRRCAAAHKALSSAAKDLVQASLQVPDGPLHHPASCQREHATQQQGASMSTLAVKPFAEAHQDVACHALTAVMQAMSNRHKQPRLSVVKNLLKRLKLGYLRGSFVANDCIISPVLFSKGTLMKVQPLPAAAATSASTARRHQ
ncbi:hypothetical protein ABBQ38_003940 [Trebouxia sp. C0009 RCD-2024]